MQTVDIIEEGKNLLALNKTAFKSYYETKIAEVRETNNVDFIVSFELQHIIYLINVSATYYKAIDYANLLIKKYGANVDPFLMARLYRCIGISYTHTGDLEKSMESYMEALHLIETIEPKNEEQTYDLGMLFNYISILFKKENEIAKRLEYIKKAHQQFKLINSESGLSVVYNALANYYQTEKELEKALYYQKMSLRLKKKMKDFKGVGINYGNIANILIDKNDFVNAERYLKLSEKLKLKYANNYSITQLYINYGEFYLKQENPGNALNYLLQAYKLASTHGLKFEIHEITELLADTYEKMGDYKKAFRFMKEHDVLNKELNDIQKTKTIIELKEKYESERRSKESSILRLKNAEIQKHITRLEHYNKDLQQFAQIASHDLKEPLRAIKMNLMFLERSLPDLNAKQNEIIDFTKKSADRLYKMVEDLKSFSNLDNRNQELENINLNALMNHLFEQNVASFKDRKLSMIIEEMPVIKANASAIKNLFSNIIDNAFYYNNNIEPRLIISYRLFKHNHIFKLSDNGVGIDQQYYNKIFDIFERLESDMNYSGTGIGLAMCRKIVQNMGGKIWLKSKVGEGSVFYISIPAI